MNNLRKHVVLRLPAGVLGIHSSQEWERLLFEEHDDFLSWEPGTFAPSLFGDSYGFFIDYILEDEKIAFFSGDNSARILTSQEKEKYLPVFLKEFPEFTMEDMNYVHYCEYAWYDDVLAPYVY